MKTKYRITDRVMRQCLIKALCTEYYDEVPFSHRSVFLDIFRNDVIIEGCSFSNNDPEDGKEGWRRLPKEYSWEDIFHPMLSKEEYLNSRKEHLGFNLVYTDHEDEYNNISYEYHSEYNKECFVPVNTEAGGIMQALMDAFVDIKTLFESVFNVRVEEVTQDQLQGLKH